ncbi:MAG: TIGR00730 family Rossman fold protein [Betaproteobacteria bacterium]
MRRICVFCGSSLGARPSYAAAARDLAAELARHRMGLVYGGGRAGLMGIVADAALEQGVEVIGVITRQLEVRERGHRGLTEQHIVETMHERKAMMARLAIGFVALPGGFGTFEELCEMITWTQLAIHAKPAIVINVDGYFDPLLAQFDRAVEEEFPRPENRAQVISVATAAAALACINAWTPPAGPAMFEPPRP